MIISTDSTSNLPKEFYLKNDIKTIPMQIILDEEVYDDLSENLPSCEFCKKMREGSNPKTAQINRENATKYFEELLKTNQDILHISFSSELSGTTAGMFEIANQLNKTHKNQITVIDTLNASAGEGLFVIKALEMKNEGKTVEEIANYLNSNRLKFRSFFTVDNLKYLVRGGRIGKFSGIVGSLLKIKPVLKVDEKGRLVSYKKVISRKKSINELAKICIEKAVPKHVLICQADCLEDAENLANLVENELHVSPQIIDLTQVICSHSGPGTLAIFFMDKNM